MKTKEKFIKSLLPQNVYINQIELNHDSDIIHTVDLLREKAKSYGFDLEPESCKFTFDSCSRSIVLIARETENAFAKRLEEAKRLSLVLWEKELEKRKNQRNKRKERDLNELKRLQKKYPKEG